MGRSTLARAYERAHRRTSLMSSSLHLQQCLACLVHLTWMVFEMRGKCPYSCCFVGCFFQDSFKNIVFLCSSRLAFSLYVFSVSMWCIPTVVLTRPQLWRNPVLFYQIGQISEWSIADRYIYIYISSYLKKVTRLIIVHTICPTPIKSNKHTNKFVKDKIIPWFGQKRVNRIICRFSSSCW